MTCSWSKVVPFTVPLLVVIVLLAGCSKPTLETIDIKPSSVTITVGQTQQLQATGRDTKGEVMEGITFAWSVQGEGGRIDATNGLFTARQPGTVSVIATAEAENVRGTATITVEREPVASLAAQMPKHVVAGTPAQFTVMAKNAAGQGLADVRVRAQALSEGTTLDQTATTDASGQAQFTVTTPTQVPEIRLQLSADEQQTTVTMQTQPGPAAAFRLTPDPETVVAGGKVQLHVAVQDHGANPVPNAPVRFAALSPGTTVDPGEAVTDTQGQVSAEVQTRSSAGVNKVQVRVADLDTQDVEIQGKVGPPARLQLRADTTATVAGGTVNLTVQVQDAHDNAVANTAVRLTVSPTDAELEAATLTSDRTGRAATALRLSQTAGAHTIEAAVANLPVTSLSIMAQAPTALRLTPQTITVDMLGTQQFRAMAVDADGNAIAVSPAWKVMGDNGTTDARGVFSATGLGDELLVATYADFTVGAHITVVPGEATSVEVTPAEATITAATNQQFHVAVFNAHRYPLDLAPSWEVTNDLGTIDSAGLLTALRAGTGEVVATVAGVTGRVNVTVAPGVLATLKVAPDQLEMRAGEENTLQATGFDAVGNEVPIKPTWSLTADLGKLDASGTLRALHVGSGKIQVAAGPVPIVVAIPVEVVAADLERLEVSPRTLTLSAGDEHAFAVTGYDAYENIVDVTPEWSLNHRVGDIDAQGLFLARRTGSAQVHATVGAHRGEASVTVKPNDLASLSVQPVGPLTLTAGSTVSLTLTGYDAVSSS